MARQEARPQAAGIGEQGTRQCLRIHGAVLRGEQRAGGVRGGARPALAHFVAGEPVAAEPGLALERRGLAQPVGLRLVEGRRGDAAAPERDVDAGGIFQSGGEVFVDVAPADAQPQHEVVARLDLRREHPGRRGGGRRGVGARLQNDGMELP